MAFRIHTLLISEIVTLLKVEPRTFTRAHSCHRTNEQSRTSPHTYAVMAAKQYARSSTDYSSDHRASYATISRCCIRRAATYLRTGILSAIDIIQAELIKVPPRPRQHKYPWAGRYRRAAAQYQNGRQYEREPQKRHDAGALSEAGWPSESGAGCGATRNHPPGHWLTYG